jgi:hypothetical protein
VLSPRLGDGSDGIVHDLVDQFAAGPEAIVLDEEAWQFPPEGEDPWPEGPPDAF